MDMGRRGCSRVHVGSPVARSSLFFPTCDKGFRNRNNRGVDAEQDSNHEEHDQLSVGGRDFPQFAVRGVDGLCELCHVRFLVGSSLYRVVSIYLITEDDRRFFVSVAFSSNVTCLICLMLSREPIPKTWRLFFIRFSIAEKISRSWFKTRF